jgi:oligopeptidase B
LALVPICGLSAAGDIGPPIAPVVPKVFEEHGQRRVDNYYWMRERGDPKVVAYLKAENDYAKSRLARIAPLINEIRGELEFRLGGEDRNPPYFENGYYYQRKFAGGAAYPVVVRHKGALSAPEEVVLDVPALAAGHEQFYLRRWVVSPDGRYVAFVADYKGDHSNNVLVRNIATGEIIDDEIEGTEPDVVFASDSKTIFYVADREVWRHVIGTNSEDDELVYEERDNTFSLGLKKSKSGRFILITVESQGETEVWYLPTDTPSAQLRVIEPRRPGMRYYAEHVGDRFYIRTNLDAPDFRIASVPEATPGAANWTSLVAETAGHYISRFEVFDRFVAIDQEHNATRSTRVFHLTDGVEVRPPRPVKHGVTTAGGLDQVFNRNPSSRFLRFRTVGLAEPETIFDWEIETGRLIARKEDPAAAWFRPNRYAAARTFAIAPDGERVPITLLYRKDQRKPTGNPTLIYGYGAYCESTLPTFPRAWLSLIDRGFVYAIAHVRGGCEMGRRWYDQGRLLNKWNSFNDFVAATEALIAQGYADRRNVFAYGDSAGGLIMGVIANRRPDLYAGIVASVPFVDVITSTSDPKLSLTTYEYREWGNPAIREHHDYMLGYSPYDNVAAQAYPPMFVTAGFNDSQVLYVEPAKWVARLRATRTDSHELIFRTYMTAGHSGPSGRFGSLEENAQMMAWLISHVRTDAADAGARPQPIISRPLH